MEFDTILAEAAPARHERLDGPESAAATALYQQITAARSATGARSRRRRLIVLPVAGVAAVAAAATALTLISGSGVTAARGQGGVRHATLAAWTAASQPDGLVKVTIRELRDPQGLARALRADGVPVNVQFIPHPFTGSTAVNAQLPSSCRPPQMSDKASALLQAKITPNVPPGPLVPGTARHSRSGGISTYSGVYKNDNPGAALYVRPSAIPQGIGLFIGAWVAALGTRNGSYLDLQADLVQASPQCTGS
jgi:hypothetical protein